MEPNDVGNIPQVIGFWYMELDPHALPGKIRTLHLMNPKISTIQSFETVLWTKDGISRHLIMSYF